MCDYGRLDHMDEPQPYSNRRLNDARIGRKSDRSGPGYGVEVDSTRGSRPRLGPKAHISGSPEDKSRNTRRNGGY